MTDERRVGEQPRPAKASQAGDGDARGFLVRYRLPLVLAVVALCGYIGSIVYIVYVRGQIG